MSNFNDPEQAISALFDIAERDPEQARDAMDLVAIIQDRSDPGDCLNHAPDSWGCCENCGCIVF